MDPSLVAVVDGHRAKFGLPPLKDTTGPANIIQLQKDEVSAGGGEIDAYLDEGIIFVDWLIYRVLLRSV